MANLTITLNDSVRVFGLQQTDDWGSMLWNDFWGYGSKDAIKAVGHVIDDSTSPAMAVVMDIQAVFNDSYSGYVDDLQTLSIGFYPILNEIYSGTTDSLYDIEKIDPNGYHYSFGDTTNAADSESNQTNYSQSSNTSSSYTRVSTPSTTWTEQ